MKCTDTPNNLLLIARKKDIRIRQLLTNTTASTVDMVIPLDGLKSTIALDWSARDDRVYWTDVGRASISRAHLNGTDQEAVITTNLIAPAGLAIDWVTDKIYWTDSGRRTGIDSLKDQL